MRGEVRNLFGPFPFFHGFLQFLHDPGRVQPMHQRAVFNGLGGGAQASHAAHVVFIENSGGFGKFPQHVVDGRIFCDFHGYSHGLPVMRRRAERFRAEFAPQEWLLDLGVGYGWHWARRGEGARILGIDFSLGNLTVARRLLGEDREDVVLVCADAAALPLRDHTMTGLWSVQTFQHFPPEVLRAVLKELERVLRAACVIEAYNLQPAALHRLLYRLLGKRLHCRGRLGEMELNRLTARQWSDLWRTFRGGRSQIRTGYSELWFHPDLRLRPRRYPVRLEEALGGHAPMLASLIARQAQVRVEARP